MNTGPTSAPGIGAESPPSAARPRARAQDARPPLRWWLLTPALAVTYVLLGVAGLLLGAPSPVYPPAGVALSAALWFGRRALPGLWLGALALNLALNWLGEHWLGDRLDPALLAVATLIATGATLQARLGSRLVIAWLRDDWCSLRREQDVLRFLVLGGLFAGVVSASCGTTALWIGGQLAAAAAPYTWWTWYVGDVIGILVFAPMTLALLQRRDVLWRMRWRRTLTPTLLSMAIAVTAFHATDRWEHGEQRRAVQQAGEQLAEDIGNRLLTHEALLSTVRRFAEVTPDFGAQPLTRALELVLRDHPDLLAISYNDRVDAAGRAAWEAGLRAELADSDAMISEMDADGRRVPAGDRAEYAPVRISVPTATRRPVLGFDSLSEPIRRAAFERARAADSLAVAAPISPMRDPPGAVGMLHVLPVRDRSAAGNGPFPLVGFVVAVVRIDSLFGGARPNALPAGLTAELTSQTSPPTLLHRSGPPPTPAARDVTWQTVVPVGDRAWTLTITASPTWLDRHRPWVAWAVGVVGLAFAALLQVLMLGMTGRAEQIERQRTALLDSERRYRELNAELEQKVNERTTALQSLNAELHRLATTDPLTGVWNRRHFEAIAEAAIANAHRYDLPLSLVLFDLDHFKAINDRFGHQLGDQVLLNVTRQVRAQLRSGDLLARWGGEEFMVMLPQTTAPEAARLAERLCHLVAEQTVAGVGRVTASFGVASLLPGDAFDPWIKRVDDALYAAKLSGRNRVCMAAGHGTDAPPG